MDRKTRIENDIQPRDAHYNSELRLRIIYMAEQDNTPPEDVARAFGISVRTIQNWRSAYDENGMAGLDDAPKSGRRPFIPKAEVKKSKDNVQKKDGIPTLSSIKEDIIDKHNVVYSENAIWKILNKMDITHKKAEPVHARAATNEEIDAWSEKNIPIIDQYCSKGHTLMAQDEVHMYLDSDHQHGYAEKGERLYKTYQGKKQKVSIIGAIGTNGKSIYRAFSTANSDTFIKFVKASLRVVPKIVMLVDGASYHCSKKVKEKFDANPNIILIRLPVGSPHMNSIENIWGKGKSHLGKSTYYRTDEFKKDALKFFRKFKFSKQAIRSKLDSRLDPGAEACVKRSRIRQEIIKQQKYVKK